MWSKVYRCGVAHGLPFAIFFNPLKKTFLNEALPMEKSGFALEADTTNSEAESLKGQSLVGQL